MSLISSKVPNLLGGVSQLPADQRDPTQVEDLYNALCNPTWGLRKRPPTTAVGTISTSQAGYDTAFVHAINRTTDERYVVVVANGGLKVYDGITGAEQTVTFPDGTGYLASSSDFRAFTVGDHTFVVNRKKTVRAGTKKAEVLVREALIFIRQGDYNTEYKVALDNEAVSVTTASEASATSRDAVATDHIAQDLHAALSGSNVQNLFDFTLLGSTIHLKRKDGGDFAISSTDGLADKGLRVIKGKVESITDLPARARNGMVVEVTGSPGSPKDNTWVKYESTGDTEGLWRECPAPGVALDLDASTMPHELVRQGKLSTPKPAMGIPRQPSWETPAGLRWTNGWTTNGSDIVLSGTEVDAKDVSISGQAVRSPAVNGSHASLPRDVTISFDLDTSQTWAGNVAEVVLSANTGSGWTQLDKQSFTAGQRYLNRRFKRRMVCPSGTRFELKLTIKNVWGNTPTRSRDPRLVAHGSDVAAPGVEIKEVPSTKLLTGLPSTVWPMGMAVSLTLDTTNTFSYTLASDMTTAQLNTALSALVDAHASYVSSYTPPAGGFTVLDQLDGFVITKTAGGSPTVTGAVFALANATQYWNSSLTMVPGEHVGRTFKNITDGSTGVITANSVTAITIGGGLTGGRRPDTPLMPVNRIIEGDVCSVLGTGVAVFVFQKAKWDERLVGNDELSPLPSFVDRTLSEVFFYGGRLGFLSEDFVVMSAAADLYRFFRRTVTKVLDDDPIDVQNAHEDAGLLDSAVNWNGHLLLCSSAGHQFELSGDPILSPATARLDHLTSYPTSRLTRPMVLGGSVLFTRQAAGYTQVRELFRTKDGGFDTALLTAHVPRYILGDVKDMCGDPDLGFAAFLTNGGNGDAIYILNFGPLGAEGRQLAWNRWTFVGYRVVGMDFVDGYLYLVIFRGTQVKLERINVANPLSTPNLSDANGANYQFRVTLSPLFLRDQNGRPLIAGRTQLRAVDLQHYTNSNSYQISVTPNNSAPKEYVITSDKLMTHKRFSVLSKNIEVTIEITNEDSVGCAFSGLVFEATYSHRSGRQ